jgi:tetratricopeptide (TPR) repeat protein
MAEFNLSLCSMQSLDWAEAVTAQTHVLAGVDQLVQPNVADSMYLARADLDAVSGAGFLNVSQFYRFRVKVTQALANSLARSGQRGAAIQRLRALLEWCRRALGTSAELSLGVANDLASTLLDEGLVRDSIAVLELVVDGFASQRGARHHSTLVARGNLATALSSLNTQDASRKAAALMRATLQLGESTLGKQHPFTLTALANLASTLSDLGEHAESEKVYREACVRGKGGNDPRLHLNVRGLAGALEAQGRFAESRALALRELSTHDAIQPNTSVVVRSLRAQTELNDKVGTVLTYDPMSGRYTVRVAGRDVSVKRECLRRARCYNPACTAEPAMSKCGRCEEVFYCCMACQRAHWPVHRPACVRL